MQLDDVREQLRVLSDRVPAGAIDRGEALARAHGTVKRRRMVRNAAWRGGLALVVVAVALAINASNHTAKKRVIVSQSTTTTGVRSTLPFTEQQLRAHDGVGVPDGWVPVDGVDARLWVPGNWSLESNALCVPNRQRFVVVVGNRNPCERANGPEGSLAISEIPRAAPSTSSNIVQGYHVNEEPLRCDCPNFFVYRVPELGVQLELTGSSAEQILGTLAPSAYRVALAFATEPVPLAYKTIAQGGLEFEVPAQWASASSDTPCAISFRSEVVRVLPAVGNHSCKGPTGTGPADTTHDGVIQYPSNSFTGSPVGGQPLTVLRHDDTTVTVARGGDPNAVVVAVHRDGSKIVHPLALGLGRDGRIAGAILASLEATT